MNAPRPVTDADVLAAVADYYKRPDRLAHIPIAQLSDRDADEIRTAIRRVLEGDRARALATDAPSTATAGPTPSGEKEQC